MTTVYLDQRVDLDGRRFVGCQFDGCVLVYRAESGVDFDNCVIRDCRFLFEGPAGAALASLVALSRLTGASVDDMLAGKMICPEDDEVQR